MTETEIECLAVIGLAAFAYLLRTRSVEHECMALIAEAAERYEKRRLEAMRQQHLLSSGFLSSGMLNSPLGYNDNIQQQQAVITNYYAQIGQAGTFLSLLRPPGLF